MVARAQESDVDDLPSQFQFDTDEFPLHSQPTPVLRPEYGVLFSSQGHLYQNLQRRYLFISIPLPSVVELYRNVSTHTVIERYLQKSWSEPVLIQIRKVAKMIDDQLNALRWQIINTVTTELPAILPNPIRYGPRGHTKLKVNNEIWESKLMNSTSLRRDKRWITAAIGITSALVSLGFKVASSFQQYKASKERSRAMQMLYERDSIVDNKIDIVRNESLYLIDAVVKRIEDVDKNSRRITEHLSQIIGVNNHYFDILHELMWRKGMVEMRKFEMMLQDVQHMLSAIDTLANGRLPSQLVHPATLHQALKNIKKDMKTNDPGWELAFQYIHQYYAEPLVTFSNTPDQLVIQIPIFIKQKTEERMNLYSIKTVPMPATEGTYKQEEKVYTTMDLKAGYIAASSQSYSQYTEPQLRLCTQFGSLYLCEQITLLHDRNNRACVAALFYGEMGNIANFCNATYTYNVDPEPQVLDAGDRIIFAHIPPPWYAACRSNRNIQWKHAAYTTVRTEELCDCDLQVGDYFVPRRITDCDKGSRDVMFTSEYYHNKILYDFLQAQTDRPYDADMEERLRSPVSVLPKLADFPIDIQEPNDDIQRYVLNKNDDVARRDLRSLLVDIRRNTDKQMYLNTEQFLQKGMSVQEHIRNADTTEKVALTGSMLGYAALIIAIGAVIALFLTRKKLAGVLRRLKESRVAEAMPLSALINMLPGSHAAYTPASRLPTLPPFPTDLWNEFRDDIQQQEDQLEANLASVTEQISTCGINMYIVIGTFAGLVVFFWLYLRCRRRSALLRVCFPLYPSSAIFRGVPHTDIFVQLLDLNKSRVLWAHVGTALVRPGEIYLAGVLTSSDIKIATYMGCFKFLHINWTNCVLIDSGKQTIKMSKRAMVSLWTPNTIKQVTKTGPFQVKLFARLLNMYSEIPHWRSTSAASALSLRRPPSDAVLDESDDPLAFLPPSGTFSTDLLDEPAPSTSAQPEPRRMRTKSARRSATPDFEAAPIDMRAQIAPPDESTPRVAPRPIKPRRTLFDVGSMISNTPPPLTDFNASV